MKKVKLNKNLVLNKQTVSQLDESSLQDVRGGYWPTYTCDKLSDDPRKCEPMPPSFYVC